MKSIKSIILAVVLIGSGIIANAESFVVALKNGERHEIRYTNRTISGKGIELDNGELIDFIKVSAIQTDIYNAYEKSLKRTDRKGSKHIKVEFTGDESVHLQKLEKLQNRRTGAHGARAAGGILAIIGAVSGDRDLYNAGMVTYGVGTIAKDINTEKTIATQNQMLAELHNGQNQKAEETEEEKYRREYGNENVDAVIALLGRENERAIALANAAETSKDANHRLSAIYVKALIAVDLKQEEASEKEYERLVLFDPEIENTEVAREEIELLHAELIKLREV